MRCQGRCWDANGLWFAVSGLLLQLVFCVGCISLCAFRISKVSDINLIPKVYL